MPVLSDDANCNGGDWSQADYRTRACPECRGGEVLPDSAPNGFCRNCERRVWPLKEGF